MTFANSFQRRLDSNKEEYETLSNKNALKKNPPHLHSATSPNDNKETQNNIEPMKVVVKDEKTKQGNPLVAVLEKKTTEKPRFKILSWVDDHCKEINSLTYTQLWEQSGAVQQLLQEKNLKAGDRVMICYPFGLEFLAGFFGAIRAGVIPCSVYPPNPKQPKASMKTFANMAKDAGAKYALTTKQFQRAMGVLQVAGHRPGVTWVATDSLKPVAHLPFAKPDLDSPAFIQYTSGSTSAPKGVVISHRAIAHSIHVTTQYMTDFKMDVEHTSYQIVSWLPQYHDMGLMNGFLMPLVSGAPCVNTSPLNFIKNPLIWADMIEKYKATSIVSPNFGYGLLAKRLQQAGRTMDASTITTAVNAAEPVSVVTLKQMVDVLGIQKTAILPAYGAAESVAIVGGNRGIETNEDGFVACGDISESLLFHKSIVILDDSKQLVPDGTVGRIHFTGPDMASGYWNNPAKTEETFKVQIAGSNDGKFYCDSGDLGMVTNDKLFITGRAKELIIINGVNKYPTDLEQSVEMEWPDSVRPGCCVAFQWNEEKIGMVIELRKEVKPGVLIPSEKDIKLILSSGHGVGCGYICFVTPHTVPKTTSGKLKRIEAARLSKSNGWKKKHVLSLWCEAKQHQGDTIRHLKDPNISVAFVHGEELEHKLSTLVSIVSGAKISTTDSIASLGLSSMDLVKLQGLIIDDLGLAGDAIPLYWLFDGELTLEVLAKRLSDTKTWFDTEVSTSLHQVTELLAEVFEDVIGVLPESGQSMGDIGVTSMNATMLHDAAVNRLSIEEFPIQWLLEDELAFQGLASRLYHEGFKPHTAKAFARDSTEAFETMREDLSVLSPPMLVSFVRGIMQLVALLLPPLFLATAIFPSVLFVSWMSVQYGNAAALLVMPISTLIYTLAAAILLVTVKWILLGKQKPGVSGVWSGQFARRWLVRQCSRICWRISPWAYLGGTEAIAILHRLLGCKLGSGVSLEPGCIEDYDLVEVGDFSSISGTILTETVSLGVQTTFQTKIGCRSTVSNKAIISPNVTIKDNVTVGIRCAVSSSTTLENETAWSGKPAKIQALGKDTFAKDSSLWKKRRWMYLATLYGTLVLSSYLWVLEFVFAIFIGLVLWEKLGWMGLAPLVWVPATSTFVVVWFLTGVAKKLLLGKVEEGSWPLYDSFHCRKFVVDHLVEAHLLLWLQLMGIFGSPFTASLRVHTAILRSLGSTVTLARNIPQELWTAYDLLQCSGSATFGGGATLHFFSVSKGCLIANQIHIGEDVFIGTTCALVAPLVLEDGATVAAHSIASGHIASNETAINTLVMKRPSDQRRGDAPQRSFRSDLSELAVGTTMMSFIVLVMYLLWLPGISMGDISKTFDGPTQSVHVIAAAAVVVFSYFAVLILPLFVATVLLISKHAIVGKYKLLVLEHDSTRYHLLEWALILKMAYERIFMNSFSGTFLEVLFHKLMGAHLGKGVYLDGVYFFEHDLIHIGSHTSITGSVGLAPHRFDRSGDSFATLRIGSRCNIRCDATLHGNDIVDDNTTLDTLSMPLIGSHLTAGTWRGYPATRAGGVEPMPSKPPTPLWYVLLQNPTALIYGTVFCLSWRFQCLCRAISKCMMHHQEERESSSHFHATFPPEHDIEAGLVRSLPCFLRPDIRNSLEDSRMRMFKEFNFDHGSWAPSLRMINMQLKAQHTWWEWAHIVWEFDVNLKSAVAQVSLVGWTIPPEILSARLKNVPDKDCWAFSLCWLEGESQCMLLKEKNDVTPAQTTDKVGVVEGNTPIPRNLPTNKLPKDFVNAIKLVELDKQKLQGCFEELNLHHIPALVEAWKQHPKKSQALQDMCMESIDLVQSNLPTVVQFCHYASQQEGGILKKAASPSEMLSSTVHAGYVLDWATKQLANDRSLLEAKLQDDIMVENSLTANMVCHDVPPGAQFLLTRGQPKDPLFGKIDTFLYLKLRSVEWSIKFLVRQGADSTVKPTFVDGLDPLSANILEAVWSDELFGNCANASAGLEVARLAYFLYFQEDFYHFYKAWNLAFVLNVGIGAKWLFSKLLIPSVGKAFGRNFYFHRSISLHLVFQAGLRSYLRGDGQPKPQDIFTGEAKNVLGSLNEQWATSFLSSRQMGNVRKEEEFALKAKQFTVRCNAIHGSITRVADSLFYPQSDGQLDGNVPPISADIIVVGAGIQGLCFARDLASLGHTVLVCERSSQIGGVWATNNYPGLRLHIPGYMYRCTSLTPQWNREHTVEENYRPTRDEILDYCKELVDHKNITLQLNSWCDYNKAQEMEDEIVVPVAGVHRRTKFLFVTLTSSLTYKGEKHLPAALPDNLASLPCSPKCFHSSEFSAENLSEVKRNKTKLVIVGSGKAAIDLLQQFEPGDKSVIWAHRGHTAFFPWETVLLSPEKFLTMAQVYDERAVNDDKARHWSEIALDEGALIACDGPLTQQRMKTARGICGDSEISHANSFPQFHFHLIDVKDDGKVVLVHSNGSRLEIDKQCFVVWCTGQRNPAFHPAKFTKRLALGGLFSASVPMSVLLPLLIAVDQLRGTNKISERLVLILNDALTSIDRRKFQTDREFEDAYIRLTQKLSLLLFTCDPCGLPGWRTDWFSAPTSVAKVLDCLLRPEIKKTGLIENFVDPQSALEDYNKFHNMTSPHFHADSCLRTFSGVVLIMPYNYSLVDPSLVSFQFQPTADEYYGMAMKKLMRETTLKGQTQQLVGRDVEVDGMESFVAETDKQLRVESSVFNFVKAQTQADSLKIIRQFEYKFGGRAQLHIMMVHIMSDNGKLSLVEVYRKLERQAAIEATLDSDIVDVDHDILEAQKEMVEFECVQGDEPTSLDQSILHV